MSLMPLSVYPTPFPTTTNNKWRIRHVHVISRSSFTATSSTKLRVTKPVSQLNQTPNYATRAAASATVELLATDQPLMTSDVEKKRKEGFWFRDWNKVDAMHLGLMIAKHGLAVCAPFVWNWGALWVTVVLSLLSGLGVTLGFHRLLTHRSFKLPKWLEYFFTYWGTHGGQRDPIYWVSVHKNHHNHTDTEKDPHSPNEGFWFSHMGWFFHNDYLAAKCGESGTGEYSNVPELQSQWFYRFLHQTYFWHTIGLGTILYLLGGFPYLAWGMGMRAVMVNHFTFLVVSVCHIWGERPWNTPDRSTNNWWAALLSFGEGWHNNHHAFPSSARHGLEWWQFDLTWEVIKFLEMVGLAKDIKLPSEAEKQRMTLRAA
ncbi:hypothetical protein SSX86_015471 [Deinandra increscens subsp. villosa]|uniref:Fatty acid desaturase domain-containing protein n=1 Tax=Deinandra increscens subsp. villosa TaxID=3103831 RepID=A0AAP0D7E4_9ASTR